MWSSTSLRVRVAQLSRLASIRSTGAVGSLLSTTTPRPTLGNLHLSVNQPALAFVRTDRSFTSIESVSDASTDADAKMQQQRRESLQLYKELLKASRGFKYTSQHVMRRNLRTAFEVWRTETDPETIRDLQKNGAYMNLIFFLLNAHEHWCWYFYCGYSVALITCCRLTFKTTSGRAALRLLKNFSELPQEIADFMFTTYYARQPEQSLHKNPNRRHKNNPSPTPPTPSSPASSSTSPSSTTLSESSSS